MIIYAGALLDILINQIMYSGVQKLFLSISWLDMIDASRQVTNHRHRRNNEVFLPDLHRLLFTKSMILTNFAFLNSRMQQDGLLDIALTILVVILHI
mmetsp:Transcript_29458/g.43491  ORF Transcript_29458/g.43491 Transcript_29458/m.43491 type:complete len:97 (+) Transcript_29458:504-794(+)